jgi:hypothetical protein
MPVSEAEGLRALHTTLRKRFTRLLKLRSIYQVDISTLNPLNNPKNCTIIIRVCFKNGLLTQANRLG